MSNTNKEKIFENIKNYYKGLSYYNRYFKDIWIVIIVLLVLFFVVIYFYIKIRISAIRKDWPAKRCNPIYIPFAGLVHQFDGKSVLESGQINFMYCQSNILHSIKEKFLSPLDYLLSIVNNVFNLLLSAVFNIRDMLQYIKKRLLEIIGPILLKIMDILNPIVVIIIYLKDIFAKVVGILKTAIYTIIGLIYIFISVILNFYKFVRLMMLVSLGITVALWVIAYVLAAIPFVGWALFPVAAAKAILATLATLVLIVFTIILSILTGKLFKKTKFANSAPPPPDVNKAKDTMDKAKDD